MKKLDKILMLLILVTIVIFLVAGCATSTMERIQDKYGPPGKVERLENGYTVFYYYKACNEYDCLCNEFTYDLNGKIVKHRRYWTQPKLR
jgi:hypothetical protein